MSNAEKLKERMRKKQSLAPAPPAPEPPATVKHTCGHEVAFREIPKDKFRNERYLKDTKRPCPSCRDERLKAEAEALAKKRATKKREEVPIDLGVGYTFTLHHLGVQQWHYELRHTETQTPVAHGEATSLRKCFAAMNKPLMEMKIADEGLAGE